MLVGWGKLAVESVAGMQWCRIVGEVFRPSPFEFQFHSFWLTRRGMILVIAGLLDLRDAQDRSAGEVYIQPAGLIDRDLKEQAVLWLEKRRQNRLKREREVNNEGRTT
jgi:hypothetical protein